MTCASVIATGVFTDSEEKKQQKDIFFIGLFFICPADRSGGGFNLDRFRPG